MTLALMVMGCLHWPQHQRGEQHLAAARQFLASGDYKAALAENHRVMANYPPDLSDQALFQIGLIYIHPHNPDQNYHKSLEAFQGLIDKYPASRLRPNAEIWILMIGQFIAQEKQIQVLQQRNAPLVKKLKTQHTKINQLQDQLEKLKRIDIKIEEKKREAIPQAEEIKEKGKGNGKDSGS
jgi:TolA-binding protein